MRTRKDITDIQDIRLLVNTFYYRASKDSLLEPLMGMRKPGSLRLEPLYQYWATVLLREDGDDVPFSGPTDIPLRHQHIDRWLSLFHAAVDELFAGPVAESAKVRAIRMSEAFRHRLQLTHF